MNAENTSIHVAVAVIKDSDGKFLIAKRPQNTHQGGFWEFPGGKLEQGEDVKQALKREIAEEVGLEIESISPLIRINHDYGDKSVLLDVWQVNHYSGEASGKEGQELHWITADEFNNYDFPAGNIPIIKALSLPEKYMITGNFQDFRDLSERFSTGLNKGLKLIQFRAHHLSYDVYFDYAKKLYNLCIKNDTQLILNTPYNKYAEYQAQTFSHGIHLTAKELKLISLAKLPIKVISSASIHNLEELEVAKKSNIDFVVISPVKVTSSHPASPALGWEKFRQLTEQATMPAYALGGMTNTDLMHAREHGGQGISAISEFWLKS